ncbi:hypothetical protein [Aeoliella sp. SH292]|uniref:hypothetical protein n=1 Tax=Aeoliella sp. SH292 TaxID=3454464 RepID=UPI003F9853D6
MDFKETLAAKDAACPTAQLLGRISVLWWNSGFHTAGGFNTDALVKFELLLRCPVGVTLRYDLDRMDELRP